MSRRRAIGHRRIHTKFISKIKSVEKRESAENQMVTDLIRVKNQTRTFIRWPVMTRW
jgi:hemerythrin